MGDWWNPLDWGWNPIDTTESTIEGILQNLFLHLVLPIILFLLAAGVLFFGAFRITIRLFLAAVFVLVGLYLMGILPIG